MGLSASEEARLVTYESVEDKGHDVTQETHFESFLKGKECDFVVVNNSVEQEPDLKFLQGKLLN